MDSYTITIAPNDGSGNTTTLVIDASRPQIRITDVNLHAPDGLTGGQTPTVDFGLLLRAVANPSAAASRIAVTTDAPAPAVAALQAPTEVAEATAAGEAQPPTADTLRPRRGARPTAADGVSEQAPRRGARGARTSASAKATQDKAAKRSDGVPATTAKKLASKSPVAKKRAVKEASSGRVYRRMPGDLAAVYQQGGTPAAIADHYDVPRHTAQGWIRRLKAMTPVSAAS